jgi:hypothetical protein
MHHEDFSLFVHITFPYSQIVKVSFRDQIFLGHDILWCYGFDNDESDNLLGLLVFMSLFIKDDHHTKSFL